MSSGDDDINEDLIEALCDFYASSMGLTVDEDVPELVYAVLQALVERVGPNGHDFVSEALMECVLAARGGAAEVH